MRPSDQRALRGGGEHVLELCANLVIGHDDHLRRGHSPDAAVDLRGHVAQVLPDELLDVPLEPGLRPASLVMAAGHLLGAVGDLVEPPRVEPEEVSALTADDSDERTVAAAHERHERRKVELASDVDAIRHGLGQRSRSPHVVEARAEHREAARAVSVELVREPLADSLEVLPQPDALVVRQAAVVLRGVALAVVQKGAHPRGDVAGGGRRARVEVDIEADRAALLRSELRQLAKPIPAHRFGHAGSFPVKAAILVLCRRKSSRSGTDAEPRTSSWPACTRRV